MSPKKRGALSLVLLSPALLLLSGCSNRNCDPNAPPQSANGCGSGGRTSSGYHPGYFGGGGGYSSVGESSARGGFGESGHSFGGGGHGGGE